ncbi:MAG: SRPBCC family protein [Thermodesulfobacteriota bacterium]
MADRPFRPIVFVLLVVTFFFAAAPAWSQDLEAQGWKKRSRGKDYETYMRMVSGSETAEVLMEGTAPFTPEQCFGVVTDYAGFPQFMPYIKYAKVLAEEKTSDKVTTRYVFFFVEVPLLSPRFYTLKLTDEKDPDGVAGAYRSAWELERGRFRKTPGDSLFGGVMKNVGDAVETEQNRGYWLFTPEQGGKASRVSYYVWSDPGGDIPSWIINKANTVALPELWKALNRRLKILHP